MTAIDTAFDMSTGFADEDDDLRLELLVSDREVIAELARLPAAERTRYARTALRIGVLCLRQARGEVDAGAIERAGDEVIGQLPELLTERAGAMTGDMVHTLAHYLDPESGVVHQRMKALLDDRSNAAFQAEAREALVAMQARKVEAARGTVHGNDFESAAGAVLADLATRRGDIYEATGATTGVVRNCKIGDHIVEMGADSRAPGARIVFEAKQKEGVRLPDALAEIDIARKNRAAQVGVFIYSARTAPDGLRELRRHGEDLVVLWDAEDPSSDIHLRAAYSVACALAMATRGKDESAAASLRGIDSALRSIEKQLKHLAEMNRWAKTIESSGSKIASRTERMQTEIIRDIELIDEQLETLASEEAAGS